ncbi:(R,R)-butanediol dehydrogenase/meso-butanediol dehydrogenase/diacetyl reductase [Labedella gwakjiensis]|uniref:(R,R)-butanediol dehydrogenase/meso-butanediol dehydrogenase/diacetyl reductase n=1 Tax=Labedella gwakjiensis TaxID=390269 RepID=A0A2P8GV38_9MICO|nr:2,3-butanediol dehydrogenase [Labedella gwakjiensis]PSL37829.1 (R,R)-butanediol dehydrogenase/meso-butanediol dehydrogenase/diacetyl reductase [Labedella gwakjiensis]RUQ87598.1 2,3-butanediol dehydrogenase [Labedella gwakjiensis]
MKAARFHARHDIRIEDIPEPELRAGAVAIDVAWCGICGTDLHEYLEGPIFVPAPGHPHPLSHEEAPVTLGHEFSGVISALGDGVTDLTVGESVVVEPYFVCGECAPCLAGNYHLCTRMGFIGLSGGGGGLSEKIVVDRRWVHPVGDIPLDQAALIEPLSVGHHAVVRSGAKAGDVALVGGAGPIGLLTAAVLKAEGCTVIISEVTEARKEKAVSTGVADYVIDPSTEDLQARVLEITNGIGVDVAFECTSVNAVLDALFDAVKPAGVIVNVSIWSTPAQIDIQKLVLKEIELRGTIAYVRDHPATIRLVQEGKVDLAPFITARIALDDLIEQGFDTLINHKETAVKVLVHP